MERTPITTGLYPATPEPIYRAWNAMSQTELKQLQRSGAHFRHARENPKAPTKAMIFGNRVHQAVLEPEFFASQYTTWNGPSRTTTEGKKQWAELLAKYTEDRIVDKDDHALCCAIRDAIWDDELFASVLEHLNEIELSFAWDHKYDDTKPPVLCKGRVDGYSDDLGIIIDLKTTDDASPEQFARTIYSYGYHIQAACYIDGLTALGKKIESYCFIAVEKSAPFAPTLYRLTKDAIELGRSEFNALLAKYVEFSTSNSWPAYATGPQDIGLPPWAFKKETNYERPNFSLAE